MNVIEAAKAAGWPQTAIDMASKQEIERMERFAQIIRNQALEDAAVCCDERAMKNERDCDGLEEEDATSLRSAAWQMSVCGADIRAMKKEPK